MSQKAHHVQEALNVPKGSKLPMYPQHIQSTQDSKTIQRGPKGPENICKGSYKSIQSYEILNKAKYVWVSEWVCEIKVYWAAYAAKNHSSLARTISASRGSFFANLTTFKRHSGSKKFSLLKITILKLGWLSKFQSLRSWGDAHLSLGVAQAPPNKNGIDLRLINFDNHPIFKIHN